LAWRESSTRSAGCQPGSAALWSVSCRRMVQNARRFARESRSAGRIYVRLMRHLLSYWELREYIQGRVENFLERGHGSCSAQANAGVLSHGVVLSRGERGASQRCDPEVVKRAAPEDATRERHIGAGQAGAQEGSVAGTCVTTTCWGAVDTDTCRFWS
jgi:hypothetical protein